MKRRLPTSLGPICLLLVLAWFPLIGAIGTERFVGDLLGELPVKVWVLENFGRIGILGGRVDNVGFPNLGMLNNADPMGSLVTLLLRPWFGRVWAYNLLVYGQIAASMLAAWALARALVRDPWAAVVSAIAFGLTPLVLAYAVTGAITDILNLWPYPLAILALVYALRAGTSRAAAFYGALSGALAGVGFVTCPYNFVIFAAMAFPGVALFPGALRDGLVPEGPPVTVHKTRVIVAAVALVLGLGVVAGSDALLIHTMMADPSSQMSGDAVSATRHVPPYKFLEPGHRDRYTAFLLDYLAVGKGALIERVAAARFYRAFSPGWIVLGLAAFGLAGAQRRGTVSLWAGIAGFCILASTGPFLPLTRNIYLSVAANPAWLLVHHVLPGGKLILEPFRYALAGTLALGVCASVGAAALARQLGRWVYGALPVVMMVEIAVVSPVPFPLATTELTAPAVYLELDKYFGPGAIIELPYFDRGTDRFNRIQFFHQLLHGRPIANEVMGFAPRYLKDNQFTARLLATEKPTGMLKVEVTDPDRVDADRLRLATDGFAGIVVDPSLFVDDRTRDDVLSQLAALGAPVDVEGRLLYRVGPPVNEPASPP